MEKKYGTRLHMIVVGERGMVYTNQGNQGKPREFHVAWKMSGKNQGIRCLVRKNQEIREFHVHTFATI